MRRVTPGVTVRLCYFASVRGIGTLCWENLNGLKAAAIYSTTTDAEAVARMRERGITHLVLLEAPGISSSIERYSELHYIGSAPPVPR